MYDFQFNKMRACDVGLLVIKRPDIAIAEREYNKKYIKGREGSLTIPGCLKDLEWSFHCNYKINENIVLEKSRQLKAWLQGSGELVVSDDINVYYKVKHADIYDFVRVHKEIAQLKIKFTCDPFAYDNITGNLEVDHKELGINHGEPSEPEYLVKGNGVCVITVNSKEFQLNVSGEARIDTRAMLIKQGEEIINNKAKGRYTDLMLQRGENDVKVSEGFELRIIPNWRYR